MGESMNAAVGTLMNALHLDAITASVGNLVNKLPAPILELYKNNTIVCLLAVTCLLVLFAFEGYKIFKMLLFAGSALGFGALGYWVIAPLLPKESNALFPEMVQVDVLVVICLALFAIFLCKVAQPFMIMLLGGIVGYLVGSTFVYTLLVGHFNTLEFLTMDVVKHIVGGAIASVMVLIFLLFFKHIYIVGTSFGGTICAALITQSILLPEADDSVKISFIILAITVGIFAVIRQYREEEKALEIVF